MRTARPRPYRTADELTRARAAQDTTAKTAKGWEARRDKYQHGGSLAGGQRLFLLGQHEGAFGTNLTF